MWPSVYLIDKHGYVRYWWLGELNWEGAEGEKILRRRMPADGNPAATSFYDQRVGPGSVRGAVAIRAWAFVGEIWVKAKYPSNQCLSVRGG